MSDTIEQTEASSLNSLVERRRKAAEARKKAQAAPPTPRPTIDLTPNADEALIAERRKSQEAQAAGAPMTLPVAPSTPTGGVIARPLRDRSRDLGTNDIKMPMLKLSQAMSKVNTDDTVRQGNYYLTTTGQNFGPEVYIVPVDMRMSYSKFDKDLGMVVCRSYDLVHGEGEPGILCEGTESEIATKPANERGCPFRLWTKDEATGKSIPPPCGKSYNYPVMILDPDDLENGKPTMAMLSLRSTGAQAAKLINSIVTEGVLTDPVWHESIIKLGVERKTNPRGTFYVTTVDYVQETSGTVEHRAAQFAKRFETDTAIYRRSVESDDTE